GGVVPGGAGEAPEGQAGAGAAPGAAGGDGPRVPVLPRGRLHDRLVRRAGAGPGGGSVFAGIGVAAGIPAGADDDGAEAGAARAERPRQLPAKDGAVSGLNFSWAFSTSLDSRLAADSVAKNRITNCTAQPVAAQIVGRTMNYWTFTSTPTTSVVRSVSASALKTDLCVARSAVPVSGTL